MSPCTLIYCYSVPCHFEGTARLILLPISTLIFWTHFLSTILFYSLYMGFISDVFIFKKELYAETYNNAIQMLHAFVPLLTRLTASPDV